MKAVPRGFKCETANNVCFHKDYLVALEDSPAKYGYYSAADPHRLSWFEEQSVVFNQPGYFDGAQGVQRGRGKRPLAADRSC